MNKKGDNFSPQTDRWAYLWLVLGAILLCLSTGQFRVAFAAWIAPAFLIRFFRSQKAGKGYWIILLILYAAYAISWQANMEFLGPLFVFLIFNIFIAAMNSLPYLADRLLAPRIPGFAATLIFPLAVTAIFLLYNLVSPMGSFGTPGYEQYSNLALIQIVSVTGLWGLTFLVSWCGPVINWAWERSFTWVEVRRGLLAFAAVVGCVLAFGGLRLALAQLELGTVRVHSFSPQLDIPDEEPDLATDLEGFRRMAQARNQALIDGSVREARQGAQIVLWAEMAGGGVEEDANVLIARGQEVAQQEGIYLVMGLRIHYPGQDRPWENKLVMIDPSGKVVIDHDKFGATILYGMMGAGEAKQGAFTVKTADSPYGILSGVVCWDADFPITMRQAGKQRSDIMFVGIGDPAGPMGVLHSQQHVFRAIENGFSLVRHDNHSSWSVASDPYGRIIAQVDLGSASEWTMVAQVPTHGVFTLYSVIGDLFGWLAVIGFVGMAGWSIQRQIKSRSKTGVSPA